MENKASKKIKWLMILILLLFLIPSGIDFAEGFSQGWKSAAYEKVQSEKSGKDTYRFLVQIAPEHPNDSPREMGSEHAFIALRETGELEVSAGFGSVWWVMVLRFILAGTATVTLILFVVRLFRFATKLSSRRILAAENIRALRGIAYILLILSLSAYLIETTEVLWVRCHVLLEGYKVLIPTPPASLIISLILLAVSEILKVGNQLQQEQDLTV